MTQEERLAWLETLQPGDQVAVCDRNNRRYFLRQVLSISRIKRWIQLSGYTMKFSRRGEAGELTLYPVTDEVRAQIRRRRLISEIRAWDLDHAPIEALERVVEAQKASGVGYKQPAAWVHS